MAAAGSGVTTGTDALHRNDGRVLNRQQCLFAYAFGAVLGLGVAAAMLALIILAADHV